MKFSSLFGHREKVSEKELWALIEVQSGLVRGSLAVFEEGKTSRIAYTVTHPLVHKTEVNSAYVTKSMLHGVEEVADVLSRIGLHKLRESGFFENIKGVQYILSSPWVISQTKTIKMVYAKPTLVDEMSVNDILDSERKSMEEGLKHLDAISIEQKIFEVKLNGYSVTNYEGKLADELSVSCAVSVSSKKILERISRAVRKHLHVGHESHHSALLLEYAGLRNILHGHHEYMVIHAHSELTDVVIIKGGMCVFISSFPFGVATVVRKIAKVTHQSIASADSLLALYTGSRLSDEEKNRLAPVITSVGKGWTHDLFSTLAHAGDTLVIPRNIILSAHSHFDFFANELVMAHSSGVAPDYKPNVTALDPSAVDELVTYDTGQTKSMRMGIYTAAIASIHKQ